MIAVGVTGTITSISLGYLKSRINRIFIFGFGFICNLVLILAILGKYVYPHPEHVEWLFIMAGKDPRTLSRARRLLFVDPRFQECLECVIPFGKVHYRHFMAYYSLKTKKLLFRIEIFGKVSVLF